MRTLLPVLRRSNVTVIKGSVPNSFSQGFPDTIAFCHRHESSGTRSRCTEGCPAKLVKGGIIIFDDYGWWGYSAQKSVLDRSQSRLSRRYLSFLPGKDF